MNCNDICKCSPYVMIFAAANKLRQIIVKLDSARILATVAAEQNSTEGV